MAWTLREYAGPGVYANPTDRTSVVRSDMNSIRLASHAFRGEGTDSGLNLDDDAASRSFSTLKVWRFEEDASGLAKILWRGRLMRPGTHRGQHLLSDARQFDLNFFDSNWDLTRLRVEADRPAETDVARIQWLGGYILNGAASTVTNARERPSTVINVTTYVPNTNTVSLPAREYSAIGPLGVIEDCARASGKAYFVYVDDAGTLILFYDLETSVALACTLSITDVSPDWTTSFPPDPDETGRDQDGTEQMTGGAIAWGDGDLVTSFDATAETDYDVAEDTLYSDADTSAEATTELADLISKRKVPEPQVRAVVYLPPEKVHLMRAGMTISFRSAACAITSAATLRISRTELWPPPAVGGLYRLVLELDYPAKLRPRRQDRGRAQVLARQAANAVENAQAAVETCASCTLDDEYSLDVTNGVEGAWDSSTAQWSAGVSFADNLGDCGSAPSRWLRGGELLKYGCAVFNTPSSCTNIIDATLELDNLIPTGSADTDGPFSVRGGLAGQTPQVTDIHGGIMLATGLISDTGVPIVIPVPRSALNLGGYTRFILAPEWRMPTMLQCCTGDAPSTCAGHGLHEDDISTGDLVLRRLVDGTYGWITASIVGTQNGVNKDFTLVGGYERIDRVTRNGVIVPESSYSATDGSTFDTVGWAPLATDLVNVRYYIPR